MRQQREDRDLQNTETRPAGAPGASSEVCTAHIRPVGLDAGVVDLPLEPHPVGELTQRLVFQGNERRRIVVWKVRPHPRPALAEGHHDEMRGEERSESRQR